jgi:hypothetical protein
MRGSGCGRRNFAHGFRVDTLMLRSLPLAVVAATLMFSPLSLAAKSESRAACSAQAGKAVDGSGQVRVYKRAGKAFACHLRSGRKTRLGRTMWTHPDGWLADESSHYGVREVDVAGRYVAYVLTRPLSQGLRNGFSDRLRLLDTRRGTFSELGTVGCAYHDEAVTVTGFGVTVTGALAWVCAAGSYFVDVRKFDVDGATLLDTTNGEPADVIDAYSLAVKSRRYNGPRGDFRAYWNRASTGPRTAPLR